MSRKNKIRKPPLVKPQVTNRNYISKSTKIKVATSNLFISNESPVNVSAMESTILNDLGGQELITISRHDLLTGINVKYNIIKDLASAYLNYNPNNIIKLQGTDVQIQSEFSYNFNTYVPEVGTGYDAISAISNGSIVYVDPNTGNVVINTVNMDTSKYVEVQFLTYDDIIDDTIYT